MNAGQGCRRCGGPLNTGNTYCSRRCALLHKRATSPPRPRRTPKAKAKTSRAGVTGRRYLAQRAKVKARRDPCWICHRPIDWDAAPRTRWSFSVDHITPRSKGGDPYSLANLETAHYGCNSRRGNRGNTPQPPTRTRRSDGEREPNRGELEIF